MLPPHELKTKEFTKSMRGYNPVEVDEHLDFIIEKYTELYRENDALDRKLRVAMSKIDAYKNEEESIRNALVNAQKAGASIIAESNERADVILRSAKTNCDRILSEFSQKIKLERDTLNKLQNMVAEFKAHLFATYQEHIEAIENINSDVPADDVLLEDENYSRVVVGRIKEDIKSNSVSQKEISKTDLEYAEDAELELDDITIKNTEPEAPIDEAEAIASFTNLGGAAPSDDGDLFADIDKALFSDESSDIFSDNADSPVADIFSDDNADIPEANLFSADIPSTANDIFARAESGIDELTVEQPEEIAPKAPSKMSVKDAILNLNRSINGDTVEEDTPDEPISPEPATFDDSEMSDEELFKLLKETLDSSEEPEPKKGKKSKKSKDALSVTDEFNIVFPDNDNPVD